MDTADLAVCFGDRRDRLPHALPALLERFANQCRSRETVPSLCPSVSPSLLLFYIRRASACHDDRGVAPGLIAEEILSKNPQNVIARRDARNVQEIFAGRAALGDVGHEVFEDGLALITRLAAFGIDQPDLVGTGG